MAHYTDTCTRQYEFRHNLRNLFKRPNKALLFLKNKTIQRLGRFRGQKKTKRKKY